MTRFTVIVALLFMLSSVVVGGANAHVKSPGSDSVTGNELAIRDQTQYDDARQWAISKWNTQNPVWVYAWFGGPYAS